LELTIEKLVYGGDGLARLPADERGRGKTVFIPFVLEDEQVEATLREQKPGFARACVDKILTASTERIEPGCPYFQRCGGCHYQHTSYVHQLGIKSGILKENLQRIAKLKLDIELTLHPSLPWNYRNRSRFRVQAHPRFGFGYYKLNSHELLPVEECPISSPLINRAITSIWQLGRKSSVPGEIQEIEFFSNADDTELLMEVYCSGGIANAADQFTSDLRGLLPETRGGVFLEARGSNEEARGDCRQIAVCGVQHLTYATKLASYRVGAGSFFQTNRHLTDELVEIVTGNRASGGSGTALDLYAGVGLFSAVLSREFERVIAVESSPTSYADLLYNSPTNVKAVHATTEKYLENAAGKLRPDLMVVDPPRSGLGDKVVQGLGRLKAPRMVYVSCDPATLSRDLGLLIQWGYRVQEAHLVDLFPQTFHVESIFHLVR